MIKKDYFVSYWSKEFNRVANSEESIWVDEDKVLTSGEIAKMLYQAIDGSLINFWELSSEN